MGQNRETPNQQPTGTQTAPHSSPALFPSSREPEPDVGRLRKKGGGQHGVWVGES